MRSVSVTTRRARSGEQNGKDYFFISKREFLKKRKAGQFLEWAEVLNSFYGTPREFVEKNTQQCRDVILSIDVQGAVKIKRKVPDAVCIFILPPSFCELEKRLIQRSTENKKEIARRLKLAEYEMDFIDRYDYIVVNDKIAQATKELKAIVQKERGR